MTTPGILYVPCDSGTGVTDAEFHDWYDNEHVPLRMALPTFRAVARWVATDGLNPQYLATYDLTSCSALTEPDYLALRTTQSEREKDVMARLELIERRIYDALPPPGGDPTSGSHELVAADYDPRSPGPYLIAVEIAMKGGDPV